MKNLPKIYKASDFFLATALYAAVFRIYGPVQDGTFRDWTYDTLLETLEIE